MLEDLTLMLLPTMSSVWDIVGGGEVYALDFYLDETCHEEYAEKLIPRAVGYSAGLLNYFFRCQLEAVNPAVSATGATFKIKNNTPNEAIDMQSHMNTGKRVRSTRAVAQTLIKHGKEIAGSLHGRMTVMRRQYKV